MSLEIC